FWFLPADATPERLRTTGVAQATIDRTLQGLPGKSLLFLDTCHAGRTTEVATRGAVDINAAVSEFARAGSGATIFASSMGREVSLERREWGNGAFTKAVNEGLFEGKADPSRSGTITPAKLQAYIEDRVRELTGGRQHPVMKLAPGVPAFAIAITKQ